MYWDRVPYFVLKNIVHYSATLIVVGVKCASQSTCHFRMLGQKINPLAFCGEIKKPFLARCLGRRADHQLPSLIPHRLSGAATEEQVFMW